MGGGHLPWVQLANAKGQEVKEREQALLEQLEVTFLDAEAPLFILVQGKKHEELDCATLGEAHCPSSPAGPGGWCRCPYSSVAEPPPGVTLSRPLSAMQSSPLPRTLQQMVEVTFVS
ncbi:hypothetical protein AV530_015752 [Patagioenas fasciata monilis]|uniref:Uncharacterized protein n=1 Tax=Patagioenas fasciata monilis TaxID=372326 RepID=A0A1V4KKF7_PATFA|nr:hypothetical protein AV530_015752 [Patagioenas fasciata monilis]